MRTTKTSILGIGRDTVGLITKVLLLGSMGTCKPGRKGIHSYDIQLGKDGAPTACPGCSSADLDVAIEAISTQLEERAAQLPAELPVCFDSLPVTQPLFSPNQLVSLAWKV